MTVTKDKARKQAVRARMAKTGERYSTARHYLLDLHRQEQANADVDGSSPSRVTRSSADSASLGDSATDSAPPVRDADSPTAETALPARVAEPSVSDAAVQRATGKS